MSVAGGRVSRRALLDRPGVRPAAGALGLAAVLALWQVTGTVASSPFLVPFSTAVAGLVELVSGPRLVADVLPSAARALAGFLLAGVIGVVLGALLGLVRGLEPWVQAPLEFLRATPIPAILPVAILVLGPTDTMRVSVIALGAVWPVLLNAAAGVRSVDPRYLETARAAGLSRARIVRRVVLPAALPDIVTGLRIGLGLALIMMVISEMIAARSGLGNFVLQAQRTYAVGQMFAGVLALGLLGGGFSLVFAAVERRVLGWYFGRQRVAGD